MQISLEVLVKQIHNMEVIIKYTNGCSKHIRTSNFFDPHDYKTEGSRRHSNLQALISDESFGEISEVLVQDPIKGVIIDRKYKPLKEKYSFYKSPEERKLSKEVINSWLEVYGKS